MSWAVKVAVYQLVDMGETWCCLLGENTMLHLSNGAIMVVICCWYGFCWQVEADNCFAFSGVDYNGLIHVN